MKRHAASCAHAGELSELICDSSS